jgi:superfamily II DNA or RNA helicase
MLEKNFTETNTQTASKLNKVVITYNGVLAQIEGLSTIHNDYLYKELSCTNERKLQEALNSYSKTPVNYEDYEIHLYNKRTCTFPVGLLYVVTDLLSENLKYEVRLYPLLNSLHSDLTLDSVNDNLRCYQEAAVNTILAKKIGILQIPTGGGKGRIALTIIKLFPTANILITVPRKKLALQLIEEMSVLGEPIGAIGGGKKDNWQRITVGIIDSLAIAVTKSPQELAKFQIVIHDECQFAGSSSYFNLSRGLISSEYIIGLSATPTRNDGCDLVMKAVCGQVEYIVTEVEIADIGAILLPTYIQIEIKDRYTQDKKASPDTLANLKPQDILKLYKYSISQYNFRNEVIVNTVKAFLNLPSRQGNILVLFEFLEHGAVLQSMLKAIGITVPLINGTVKKVAERRLDEQTLELFRSNQIPILLGSKIFREGVNLPNLEVLILTGCSANNVGHWQQIGRVLRSNADYQKERSIVIDYCDKGLFNRRATKRVEYVIDKYGVDCNYSVKTIQEAIDIAESVLVKTNQLTTTHV